MSTPGPYFFDQMVCSRRADGSLVPTAIPAACMFPSRAARDGAGLPHPAHPAIAEDVETLVELLNKGTHFDRLLAAAKRLKDTEDRWVESGGVVALKELYAAIDEAEGGSIAPGHVWEDLPGGGQTLRKVDS